VPRDGRPRFEKQRPRPLVKGGVFHLTGENFASCRSANDGRDEPFAAGGIRHDHRKDLVNEKGPLAARQKGSDAGDTRSGLGRWVSPRAPLGRMSLNAARLDSDARESFRDPV